MEHVIITGAGSGIGRDAAEYLCSRGFFVHAGVRRAEDLAKFAGRARVRAFLCDVTDEASVAHAREELDPLLASAPAVHLVNNAGLALGGPSEGLPVEIWREQFEVNVFGALRVAQAFLPRLRATHGRLVQISSVSGLVALPFLGPYASSKFALEGLTDALRRELKCFGVPVILLEPGPVATPIWERSLGRKEAVLERVSPELRELYAPGLATFFREVEASAAGAVPVRHVSCAIERALRARRPRARYVVATFTTRLQIALIRRLPIALVDALLARRIP